MPDLFDQLRGYGRQIEAAQGMDAAEGPASTESATVERAPGSTPRSTSRSRRSAWVLVAAATAAVAITASLLLPAASPDGGATDHKSSGLLLGVCPFAGGCTSGADGTDTGVAGQSVTSATTDAAPKLFNGGPDIAPGTYSFDLQGVPMQITVPVGWTRHEDFYLTAGPEETSDGFLAFFDVTDVYKDPCNWGAGKAGIGPTVDDLVAGLQAQPGLLTSAPKRLNVDGFTGTELTFSTSSGLDLSSCYTGTFALWSIESNGPTDRQIDSRPGDTGTVWILDLNGKRGVVSFGSDDPKSATSAQIKEMVSSLMIG